MVKIFNTFTKKKEELKPIEKNKIKLYSCGPTVYNYAHIGNLRAFLIADLLKRVLMISDFTVKHVMNITDVDDKIIRGSQKEGLAAKAFAKKYEKAFFEDLKALEILPANEYPRATKYIKQMVDLVQTLIDKGFAYEGSDGSIYYSIKKFKPYGKLSKINLDALKGGASGRIKKDEYTKEEANDFALWKAHDKSDGDVYWDVEFTVDGLNKKIRGRPGWHIECSVMSKENLGDTFDIHTGGIDLVFPHHENEIAQSEAATGKKFVNYWVHNEHLLVNNKKMSKSLGNFYTLRDLVEKGYSPIAFRYVMLATHYRQQLNFTFESLDAAKESIQRLQDFVYRVQEVSRTRGKVISRIVNKFKEEFISAIEDDLDTPKALTKLFKFVKEIYNNIDEISITGAKQILEAMKLFNKIFAVVVFDKKELPPKIAKLIKQREQARESKNWALSDELRDELKEEGYIIEDTPNGTRWKRANS